MTLPRDRQLIAAARNMVTEYGSLLELVRKDLTEETDAESKEGTTAFDMAKKTIRSEARKQAFTDLINRIKSYGNQRLD